MLDTFRSYWDSTIWPSLKPALWTALFTFLGLFGATLTGWLGDVADWAAGEGVAFPDPSVLSKAAVSAAGAAFAGLVNWVVRYIQTVTGKGTVPEYTRAA